MSKTREPAIRAVTANLKLPSAIPSNAPASDGTRPHPLHTATEPSEGAAPRTSPQFGPVQLYNDIAETMTERIKHLEGELAQEREKNVGSEATLLELHRLQKIQSTAEAGDDFRLIPTNLIREAPASPSDRLPISFEDDTFKTLLASINTLGQNEAITVRPVATGEKTDAAFEIAAGRRRLAACRILGRNVLARVRDLTDTQMMQITYTENEEREGISPLERGAWLAKLKTKHNMSDSALATALGMDRSHVAHLIRVATNMPQEILERLTDPRKMTLNAGRAILQEIGKDPKALGRMLKALDNHRTKMSLSHKTAGRPIDEVALALDAARAGDTGEDDGGPLSPTSGKSFPLWRNNRRLFTVTSSRGPCSYVMASDIPREITARVAERLADILAEELDKHEKAQEA